MRVKNNGRIGTSQFGTWHTVNETRFEGVWLTQSTESTGNPLRLSIARSAVYSGVPNRVSSFDVVALVYLLQTHQDVSALRGFCQCAYINSAASRLDGDTQIGIR